MRCHEKILAMIIFLLLIGVNMVPVIPAGESQVPSEGKSLKLIWESEHVFVKEEEETVREEEPPKTISYGPGDPEPTGGEIEVDAQGPYGTPADPYYEGENIQLQANMINANVSDYYFAWDIKDDFLWEKPLWSSEKGDPNFTYQPRDDFIGPLKVDAWDGASVENLSGNTTMFNDSLPTSNIPLGGEDTVGVKFMVLRDVTAFQLGMFNASYDDILYIRLWADSGTLLAQVRNPIISENEWGWFDIPPVALTAGEDYIVSAGINGSTTPFIENPGTNPEEIVTPKEFMIYDGNPYGFPGKSEGESPLPLVDFRYDYDIQKYITIRNYTGIYILNVPPTVDAGANITATVGDEIIFSGFWSDPGKYDYHFIEWDFGDGEFYYYSLKPNHKYDTFGVYTVTLKVTDDDGGVGTDTLIVTIQHPHLIKDLLQELIHTIEEMNLHPGLENSLISKLENAFKSFAKGNYEAAINQIEAFMNQIRAVRGKWIQNDEHARLISLAFPIIVYLRDY